MLRTALSPALSNTRERGESFLSRTERDGMVFLSHACKK